MGACCGGGGGDVGVAILFFNKHWTPCRYVAGYASADCDIIMRNRALKLGSTTIDITYSWMGHS